MRGENNNTTNKPIKILTDSCTRHHAVAIEGRWQHEGTALWGNVEVPVGALRSVLVGHSIRDSNGGDQSSYIAALVKNSFLPKLAFYTSDALEIETWHQPSGLRTGTNYGDVSLFQSAEFERLNTLTGFTLAIPSEDPIVALRDFIDQQKSNVFIALSEAFSSVTQHRKWTQDAWHITSAIEFKMDFFLTTDFKLLGQINSFKDRELRDRILKISVSPEQLCDRLGISPLSETEYNEFAQELSGFLL